MNSHSRIIPGTTARYEIRIPIGVKLYVVDVLNNLSDGETYVSLSREIEKGHWYSDYYHVKDSYLKEGDVAVAMPVDHQVQIYEVNALSAVVPQAVLAEVPKAKQR